MLAQLVQKMLRCPTLWRGPEPHLGWAWLSRALGSSQSHPQAGEALSLLWEGCVSLRGGCGSCLTQPSPRAWAVLGFPSSLLCPGQVNTQLYSLREKQQLAELISTMLTYNLTYLQERLPEGQYAFKLDP